MSTPPPSSDALAAQVAAAYILAEQNLLAGATSILRRTPADFFGQVRALQMLRQLVARILPGLASMDRVAVAMVSAASGEGVRGADAAVTRELALIGAAHGGGRGVPPVSRALGLPDEPFDLSMPHGVRAAQAIRDDIVSELQDVRRRITRLPDDIYKAIAPHGAIYQVLPNPTTPVQAQAMAWRVFASQGITGFVDRSGREWSMSAYTEMAVRTAATRAFNDSHLQRFHAIGVDYFSVPEHENPCPLCFPWQHKILTDGPNPNPDVHTDGTLAEAIAAGLFHPNCRHTLIPFFPGVSKLSPPKPWTEELAQQYRDTQRQRALERDIRAAKRRLEYAADPSTAALAQKEIRQAQARVRSFLAGKDNLPRQSRREQLDLTDAYAKLPELPR